VFGLLSVAVIAVGALLAVSLAGAGMTTLAVASAVLAGVAVLGLALVQSALTGIYSAALYRFAVGGDAPAGFDGALLREAFQRKE
jgi:hypothetical protein